MFKEGSSDSQVRNELPGKSILWPRPLTQELRCEMMKTWVGAKGNHLNVRPPNVVGEGDSAQGAIRVLLVGDTWVAGTSWGKARGWQEERQMRRSRWRWHRGSGFFRISSQKRKKSEQSAEDQTLGTQCTVVTGYTVRRESLEVGQGRAVKGFWCLREAVGFYQPHVYSLRGPPL